MRADCLLMSDAARRRVSGVVLLDASALETPAPGLILPNEIAQ